MYAIYMIIMSKINRLGTKGTNISTKAKKVYVIFNNNSGGHAANNAKTYQRLLNIEYEGLAPQQLKLF